MPITKNYVPFVSLDFYYNCFDAHRGVYGSFSTKRIEAYVPYCLLKHSIVDFYNLELEYFNRKTKGLFWNEAYEEHYRKRLVALGLIVVRFTVAAAVGEARHFTESRCGCANGSDYDFEQQGFGSKVKYAKNLEQAKAYKRLIMGGLGYSKIPAARDVIYRSFVPEYAFLKYLVATRFIFHNLIWGSSFGGKKWGDGCDHAIRLYRAICTGTFSQIAICFDTLINHFHNGGLLLNKFSCMQCNSIDWVLNAKRKGWMKKLNEHFADKPCERWGKTCHRALRVKPIGGNNGKKRSVAIHVKGKETKEKEKSGKAGFVPVSVSTGS